MNRGRVLPGILAFGILGFFIYSPSGFSEETGLPPKLRAHMGWRNCEAMLSPTGPIAPEELVSLLAHRFPILFSSEYLKCVDAAINGCYNYSWFLGQFRTAMHGLGEEADPMDTKFVQDIARKAFAELTSRFKYKNDYLDFPSGQMSSDELSRYQSMQEEWKLGPAEFLEAAGLMRWIESSPEARAFLLRVIGDTLPAFIELQVESNRIQTRSEEEKERYWEGPSRAPRTPRIWTMALSLGGTYAKWKIATAAFQRAVDFRKQDDDQRLSRVQALRAEFMRQFQLSDAGLTPIPRLAPAPQGKGDQRPELQVQIEDASLAGQIAELGEQLVPSEIHDLEVAQTLGATLVDASYQATIRVQKKIEEINSLSFSRFKAQIDSLLARFRGHESLRISEVLDTLLPSLKAQSEGMLRKQRELVELSELLEVIEKQSEAFLGAGQEFQKALLRADQATSSPAQKQLAILESLQSKTVALAHSHASATQLGLIVHDLLKEITLREKAVDSVRELLIQLPSQRKSFVDEELSQMLRALAESLEKPLQQD